MRLMPVLVCAMLLVIGTAVDGMAASAVLYSAPLGTSDSYGVVNYVATVVNLEGHPVTATVSFCSANGVCSQSNNGHDCVLETLQAQQGCTATYFLDSGGFRYLKIELTSQTGSSILARGLLHAHVGVTSQNGLSTLMAATVTAH